MAQVPLPDPDVTEKCEDHGDLVYFACVTCNNSLVCNKCITTTHRKHEFCSIKDFVTTQRATLADVLRDADKLLNIIQNKTNALKWTSKDNDTRSKNTIKRIRKKGERLKKLIDRIVTENVEKCKGVQKANREIISQFEDRLKSTYESIKSSQRECVRLLDSVRLGDVLKANIIGTAIREATDSERTQTAPKLTICQVKELCDQKRQHEVKNALEMENIEEFAMAYESNLTFEGKNKKGIVWSLTPSRTGMLWVGYEDVNEIELMALNGQSVDLVELNCWPYDISLELLDDETRMIISGEDKYIYQIFPGTNAMPLELFKTDGEPEGVTITLDGDILVATSRPTNMLLYNFQGKRLKTLDFDDGAKSLLTNPHRIKINPKTGDIYVINWDPDCVVIFDRNLEYKFTYKGEKRKQTPSSEHGGLDKESFSPKDVEFDRHGSILIADSDSGKITMLDSHGAFVRTILSDELGPYSLYLHEDQSLWVGYQDGTVKCFQLTPM